MSSADVRKTVVITTSSFDVVGSAVLQRLAADGFEVVLNPYKRRLTAEEVSGLLAERRPVGMIAGIEPLTRAVLESVPSLRVISRCGIGLDSVDLAAARDRGITVLNTPDGPTRAVAELTLTLIMIALRRVGEADRSLRAGTWSPLMGGLLGVRTVGLVGYGRIGRRVAALVRAFGARVVVCDPGVTARDADVDLLPLPDLLACADIVSLHLPYAAELHHLIDAAAIERMKPGAILVNAARGGLVDEAAAAAALASGHLAAAAFDTFEIEPYAGPLRDQPTAVLTCHMGSYAAEARALMEAEAADNLLAALQALGVFRA